MIEISIGFLALVLALIAGRTINRQKEKIDELNLKFIDLDTKMSKKLEDTERWYKWLAKHRDLINDKIAELPEGIRADWQRIGIGSIEQQKDFIDRVEPILNRKRGDWQEQSIRQASADRESALVEQKVRVEAMRDLGRLVSYLVSTEDALSDRTKARCHLAALALLDNLAYLSTVGLVDEEKPWSDLLRCSGNGLNRDVAPFDIQGLHELLVDLHKHKPDKLMAIIDSMPQPARSAMMRLTIAMPKPETTAK